jgi:hypothetical protein
VFALRRELRSFLLAQGHLRNCFPLIIPPGMDSENPLKPWSTGVQLLLKLVTDFGIIPMRLFFQARKKQVFLDSWSLQSRFQRKV